MIVWDYELLNKLEKITNNTKYMGLCPYQRYKSYEELFDEIKSWVTTYPNYEQEIKEYRNSLLKLNNKDLWAIVEYIGKSNYSFTKNKYYYVVMYVENNSWIIDGIIDNEEYNSFMVWDPNSTNPIDLVNDLKIVVDPSNNLKNEFNRIMKTI